MAPRMKFRDLLQSESESFLWTRSDNLFRLSTSFGEIIYAYLVILEASHANNEVHQWANTKISRNLRFIQGDHTRISFRVKPVTATDFNRQRENDFRDLAAFIEYVHLYNQLPEITEDHCPELVKFLELLRNSAGQELRIKEHYCLWDFHKRFEFFEKLHVRYDHQEFAIYFKRAIQNQWGVHCNTLYPNGFGVVLQDEPLLYDVYLFSSYQTEYCDLFRYGRNLSIHYSTDRTGNPRTERDAEWLFYKKFPFLLKDLCELLMTLNIYYEFA